MADSKISIRRQEPADSASLHQVYGQPKVIYGTLQMPYPSLHLWETRGAKEPDNMIRLVACVNESVVGNIAMWTASNVRRRHVGEVAMAVHDDWQGKGCGARLMQAALDLADHWLNLSRVELQVFTDNAPAIALYERNGFSIEGTMKAYAFRDGQYADVYAMARVRAQS